MGVWINSLLAVLIVSLVSLIGIFALAVRMSLLRKILLFLVSFSTGALFGGAFFHLLPESTSNTGFTITISIYVIIGILFFFLLEKFIHWRHCHIPTSTSHPHHLGIMNLVGDSFHNLIDGMVIAGSFLVNAQLGIATTLAILFHEIPQEIGDFGVLLHAGYSKAKALFCNFLTALMAFIGVVISLLIGAKLQNYTLFLLPFTAGGFIYIAGSDLIPELHKECSGCKSIGQFVALVLGIAVMLIIALLH